MLHGGVVGETTEEHLVLYYGETIEPYLVSAELLSEELERVHNVIDGLIYKRTFVVRRRSEDPRRPELRVLALALGA